MAEHKNSPEIEALRAENHRLRQQLATQQADIYHLLLWYQQLQRDIADVYASVTWRMGAALTRFILWLLRHPQGPTAQDHIERLNTVFTTWQQQYFAQYEIVPYTAWHDTTEYHAWLTRYENFPTPAQVRDAIACWPRQASFGIFIIAEDDDSASVNSVLNQSYPHWRGYVASPLSRDHPALTQIKSAGTYADTVNEGLRHVAEDYVICLSKNDSLAPNALFEIARAVSTGDAVLFLYTDHDHLDATGQRSDPFFKPDWSEELSVEQNYLGRAIAFNRRALQDIGGFNPAMPGLEHYDAALRLREQQPDGHIYHLPQVVYHQRERAREDIQACVQAHFARTDARVNVQTRQTGHTQVLYPLPQPLPLVSAIIPTRDQVELLRGTVEGLRQHTDYAAVEIIIVDNGSRNADTLAYFAELKKDARIKIIREDAPFNFSRLNNLAATQARGELLALLNNDLRMIRADWLSHMVRHAAREDIGAVGAKLYYSDDTLQHAGVVTGLGGLAGHPFKHVHKTMPAYHWRPFVTYNCNAVTAACLLLRKSVFDAVDGFDEHLKVAFNDVDLCLRIRQQGLRIVWTPDAELYHLESVSRGSDDTPRKFLQLQRELAYMRKRWGDLPDPYYNPNLTLQYEDYALAWPPRV
jgi:GT2 family glycosyltransferase